MSLILRFARSSLLMWNDPIDCRWKIALTGYIWTMHIQKKTQDKNGKKIWNIDAILELANQHLTSYHRDSAYNCINTYMNVYTYTLVCVCVFFCSSTWNSFLFHHTHTHLFGLLRKRPNQRRRRRQRLAKRQQFIDDTYWPHKMYWKMYTTSIRIYMCKIQLYKFIIGNDYLMTYHLDNDYFDGKNESHNSCNTVMICRFI